MRRVYGLDDSHMSSRHRFPAIQTPVMEMAAPVARDGLNSSGDCHHLGAVPSHPGKLPSVQRVNPGDGRHYGEISPKDMIEEGHQSNQLLSRRPELPSMNSASRIPQGQGHNDITASSNDSSTAIVLQEAFAVMGLKAMTGGEDDYHISIPNRPREPSHSFLPSMYTTAIVITMVIAIATAK